ncbi:transcription antitermination factor NusB [Patescibacteria group bacterium]|nr:transcription antitermination factor NusB [Patescibacteria group bacterium]
MKKGNDPRHRRRERIIKSLFEWSFGEIDQPRHPIACEVLTHCQKIDQLISQNAPEWPLEQINKVDLAVLRLALYELVINPSEPKKVIIDEAVELGKKYGSEKSSSFINGVLGTVVKTNDQKNDQAD